MYTITKNGEPVSPTKEVLAEIAMQVEEENDGYPSVGEILYKVDSKNITPTDVRIMVTANNYNLDVYGKHLYDLGLICDTKEQAQKRLDHDIALARVKLYIRVNDLAVSDEDLNLGTGREYIFFYPKSNEFYCERDYTTIRPSKIPPMKWGRADTIIKKFEPELRTIFGV